MALTLAGSPQPTLGLLDLPSEAWGCVAEQLEKDDRIRLGAACRPLRAASVEWFRGDVLALDARWHAPTAEHVAWLCRVHAQVDLALDQAWSIASGLAAGGARIVKLRVSSQHVPAELEGLTQLRELSLAGNRIQGGWQSLPAQLQQLDLGRCGLQRVPAAVAGLTQLRQLLLSGNSIQGGWQSLPAQLQQLDLGSCNLHQVPAQLSALTQLSKVTLYSNPIQGGWQHLPRQLRQLSLESNGLQAVPAELTSRAQLTGLTLGWDEIQGGWEALPPQLQRLDLRNCGLQQVPAALAGLAQLREVNRKPELQPSRRLAVPSAAAGAAQLEPHRPSGGSCRAEGPRAQDQALARHGLLPQQGLPAGL